MNKKQYRVYTTDNVEWNLNIIGIRNKANSPVAFDDTLVVFHKFMDHWYITHYPITTDPSIHYLLHPGPKAGTAILKEGQYKGVYTIDKHNGKYDALCQRMGDVVVYRDNNKDGKLNMNESTTQTGRFGINIHKGPNNGNFDSKNTIYSAGCQVFADSRHFAEFMLKCKNGASAFGNKFTYTLLNEKDFE
ncbi:MAG: hypothetical protein KF862_00130 [Chitinophagaceae bacterium]|nr:hypothetical protein [Chitinophagaceae bacterium]